MSAVQQALFMVGGDPFWADVALLLKFEGQPNGSTTIVDSSSFADNKVAGSGFDISTSRSRFGGGSLRCFVRVPPDLVWSAARFARPNNTAMTIEGWGNAVTKTSGTARPWIFVYRQGLLGGLVCSLSQYGLGQNVEFRVSGVAQQFAYTVDANGWFYYCVRIKTNNTVELWLNTTLVNTQSFPDVAGTGSVFLNTSSNPGSDPTIEFFNDNFRVTKADRYPAGITALPGDFPTGG
jgi:hypothetical protein